MMKTLTKAALINNLVKLGNISKQDGKLVVECFFKTLNERLIGGETVKISGLGNFVLRDKKARPGRNPKTGKDAVISARRVVTFRAGQKLKARIVEYKGENKGD
jgi:integration host factor subunit alpha